MHSRITRSDTQFDISRISEEKIIAALEEGDGIIKYSSEERAEVPERVRKKVSRTDIRAEGR